MLRKPVLLIVILGLWGAKASMPPMRVPIRSGLTEEQPRKAIKLDANFSSRTGGAINVKAPPYMAKGDCSADDTTALQSAIDADCSTGVNNSSNRSSIYLPPTPEPGCYKITKPLRIWCNNVTIRGVGKTGSKIEPNVFYGPAFLLQSNAVHNYPQPFLKNISVPWKASRSYPHWSEIKDSNGNIEVATTSGTSGRSKPTWCRTQGCKTGPDGTVIWMLENVGATWGGGNVFDGLAAGVGGSGPRDLGWGWLDLDMASAAANVNGLSVFTVEAELNPLEDGLYLFAASPFKPYSYYNGAAGNNQHRGGFALYTSGGYLHCAMKVGGTVYDITSRTQVTYNKWHHFACSLAKGMMYLFDNGSQVQSAAHGGTLTLDHGDRLYFAARGGFGYDSTNAYIAWARISTGAYTQSFTPPTTKPTDDGNTRFLLDFPDSPAPGIIRAVANHRPFYLPYGLGADEGAPSTNLKDFSINDSNAGGPAIWADWSYNSWFHDLAMTLSSDVGIMFNSNEFQSRIDDSFIWVDAAGNSTEPVYGIDLGGQCGGCTVSNIQLDGSLTTVLAGPTDAGLVNSVRVTGRGTLEYPFILGGNDVYNSLFVDEEGSAPLKCWLYADSPWAPDTVVGGEIIGRTSASGAALVCQDGGSPIDLIGSHLDCAGCAEAVNIIAQPTKPITILDSDIPVALPLSNNSEYVTVDDHGTHAGSPPVFANGLKATRVVLGEPTPPQGQITWNLGMAPRNPTNQGQFVGTYNFGGGGTGVAISKPWAVVNGDLLTACIGTGTKSSNTIKCPAGFDPIPNTGVATTTPDANGWYFTVKGCKRIADNEPNSYRITWSQSGVGYGIISDWKNARGGVVASGGNPLNTSSVSFTLNKIGRTTAPELIETCVHSSNFRPNSPQPSGNIALSGPILDGLAIGTLATYYSAPATDVTFTQAAPAPWAGAQWAIAGTGNVYVAGKVSASTLDAMALPSEVAGTTAGHYACNEPFQGAGYKKVVCHLDGYENSTAKAQEYTYPKAMTAAMTQSTSMRPMPSAAEDKITFPTNMTAPITGVLIVEGF